MDSPKNQKQIYWAPSASGIFIRDSAKNNTNYQESQMIPHRILRDSNYKSILLIFKLSQFESGII